MTSQLHSSFDCRPRLDIHDADDTVMGHFLRILTAVQVGFGPSLQRAFNAQNIRSILGIVWVMCWRMAVKVQEHVGIGGFLQRHW